jgi:hypothetical protein
VIIFSFTSRRDSIDRGVLECDNQIRRFSGEVFMASTRQRNAARKNIKKAAGAARRKRTISKLPKRTRTALGKQGAKMARPKRRSR